MRKKSRYVIRSKADVETHSAGYYAPFYPALNVKVYDFPNREIEKAFPEFEGEEFFDYEKRIDQAKQFALECAQESFWENAAELADEVFGSRAKVYSAGSSGGWLIVKGIGLPEDWDLQDLNSWRSFAAKIGKEIEWQLKAENLIESIEANQWHLTGAEKYNFVDTKEGTYCIAELKEEAKKAGFGAVIR